MLTMDKCIISKYNHNFFSCVVILARIILISSGVFESGIVEAVRCFVVRSTRRTHVLLGRPKTAVMLSAAALRRNHCWSSLNNRLAEI